MSIKQINDNRIEASPPPLLLSQESAGERGDFKKGALGMDAIKTEVRGQNSEGSNHQSANSGSYKPSEVRLELDAAGNPDAVVCQLTPNMQRILISVSRCYQPQAGQLLAEMFKAWQV